jgi:hypothetical protein
LDALMEQQLAETALMLCAARRRLAGGCDRRCGPIVTGTYWQLIKHHRRRRADDLVQPVAGL